MATQRDLWMALRDIREVERKYGVRIGSCGCCASPWLQRADDADDNIHPIDEITDDEIRKQTDNS